MDDKNKDQYTGESKNVRKPKESVREKFKSWKAAGKAARKLLSTVNRKQRHSRDKDRTFSDGMNEMLQQHESSLTNSRLSGDILDCKAGLVTCMDTNEISCNSPVANDDLDLQKVLHSICSSQPKPDENLLQSFSNCQSITYHDKKGNTHEFNNTECFEGDSSYHELKDYDETECWHSDQENFVECSKPASHVAEFSILNSQESGKSLCCSPKMLCQEQEGNLTEGGVISGECLAAQVTNTTDKSRDTETFFQPEGTSASVGKTLSFVEEENEKLRMQPDESSDTKKKWNMLREKIKRLAGQTQAVTIYKQSSVINKEDDDAVPEETLDREATTSNYYKHTGKERHKTMKSVLNFSSESSDSEERCVHRYSYVRKKTKKLRQASLNKQNEFVLPVEGRDNNQCDCGCRCFSKDEMECSGELSVMDFLCKNCGHLSSRHNSVLCKITAEVGNCDEVSVPLISGQINERNGLSSCNDLVAGTLGNCSSPQSQDDAVPSMEEKWHQRVSPLCHQEFSTGTQCICYTNENGSLQRGPEGIDSWWKTTSNVPEDEFRKNDKSCNLCNSQAEDCGLSSCGRLKQLHHVKASVERLLLLNQDIDSSRPLLEQTGVGSLISNDEFRCNAFVESQVSLIAENNKTAQEDDVYEAQGKAEVSEPELYDTKQSFVDSYVRNEGSQQSQLLDELQEKVSRLLDCNALRIGRLQLEIKERDACSVDNQFGTTVTTERDKLVALQNHKNGLAGSLRKIGDSEELYRGGKCLVDEVVCVSPGSCGSQSGAETDVEDNTEGLPTLISSSEDEGERTIKTLTPVQQSPSEVNKEIFESPESLIISIDSDLCEGLCDLDIQTNTDEEDLEVLISPREIESLPKLISSDDNSPYGSEADDEFECDCSACFPVDPHLGNTTESVSKEEKEESEDTNYLEERRELHQSQEYLGEDLPPQDYFEAETDMLLGDSDDNLADSLFTPSMQWNFNINLSLNDLNPLELLMARQGRWDLLAFMFQNVILQMLSVYPDLLSDQAPPPLTPDLVNLIPVVTIDLARMGQDSRCPICLCEFEVGEEARELKCHHTFHILCIAAWLAKSATCPVCRDIVKPESYQLP